MGSLPGDDQHRPQEHVKEGVVIKWGIALEERVDRRQSTGGDRLGDGQVVIQVPALDPALPAVGGRADGQSGRQQQQRRDQDHEYRGRNRFPGERSGDSRTEGSEDEQTRYEASQHTDHMKTVEGKDQTAEAQSERCDGQRGGAAVEDVRQRVESGRRPEAPQEGVAGKKQAEEDPGHCPGERPREQRQGNGKDQESQAALD